MRKQQDFTMPKTERKKMRITTSVDADIIEKLKEMAGERGYQTLLNKKLRESVFGSPMQLLDRIDKLEKEIKKSK